MAFGTDQQVGPPKVPPFGAPRTPIDDPQLPGTPGAPKPPAPAPSTPVKQPPPQWKTDLWNQYKKEGKPGDWQAYWKARRPGAPPLSPAPGTPAPGPTPPPAAPMPPLNPSVPPGQPATPEQMFPALGMPMPDYQMPWGPMNFPMMMGDPFGMMGGISMPGDFNDPYNAYLAAIPVMETMRDQQISDSMAKAGFSGNRYSSSAINAAGRIGAETSQQLNQMLNQTMYDQANQDLNRAMQAAGMGMNLGGMMDEMQRARLNQMFGYGSWEQGRQDNYGMLGYQDFENNKLGFLPYLIQALGGVGAPTPGTPVQTVTNPGTPPKISPELIDIFKLLIS